MLDAVWSQFLCRSLQNFLFFNFWSSLCRGPMLQNLLNHISWSNNRIVTTGADAEASPATSGMLGVRTVLTYVL